METKKFTKYTIIILCTLSLLYLSEQYLASIKENYNGLIIGTAELIAESLAAFYILFSFFNKKTPKNITKIALIGFFSSLFVADFFYILLFYLLKRDASSLSSVILTKAFYTSAFIFGSIAILGSLQNSLFKFIFSKNTLISLFITLPVASRFVIFPYISQIQHHPLSSIMIGEGSNIITLFILANIAIVTFINARSLEWSFFSSGVITLALGDWAMRVETSLGNTPVFGIYEFLWGLGVFLCATSILLSKQLSRIESFERQSLLNCYKLATVLLVFISIVFLCLSQQNNIAAIRIISIGTSLGFVLATLISHFLIERISHFSKSLGYLISEKFLEINFSSRLKSLPLELQETFLQVFEKKIQSDQIKILQEKQVSLAKIKDDITKQVAHDIRSPLAALSVLLSSTSKLPEQEGLILKAAIGRIRDIANNLLNQKIDSLNNSINNSHKNSIELIPSHIETIISEKNVQYSSYTKLEIELLIKENHYEFFSNINSIEFKRVLSNIINNAIESLPSFAGKVTIALQIIDKDVQISVIDNGKGISPEILPQLMKEGKTFGKKHGSGLGLYHAKTTIESWNGTIEIFSLLNKGTSIIIKLPRANSPNWFLPQIKLNNCNTIAILDDDASIHEVWKSRFNNISNLRILHFRKPEAFQLWKQSEAANKSFYLIDFDFVNSKINGLDLIDKFKLGKNAVLVTSNFEEESIRIRCERLGNYLLPKGQAAFIPLSVE